MITVTKHRPRFTQSGKFVYVESHTEEERPQGRRSGSTSTGLVLEAESVQQAKQIAATLNVALETIIERPTKTTIIKPKRKK